MQKKVLLGKVLMDLFFAKIKLKSLTLGEIYQCFVDGAVRKRKKNSSLKSVFNRIMGIRGSYESWVELGYQLFSEEGHEGFQVDRLARILGKNKSSFYHYFPEKEMYFDALVNLHWKKVLVLKEKFYGVDEFDPGFIQILLENKQKILFHMNLSRNKDIKLFRETYHKINEFIDPAIIPLWAKHFGISESLARQLFPTARDTFYGRLAKDIFTDEFIRGIVREIKEFIEKLLLEKSVNLSNLESPIL